MNSGTLGQNRVGTNTMTKEPQTNTQSSETSKVDMKNQALQFYGRILVLPVFLALAALPSLAVASDRQYECTVKQMWQVEKNGTAYISSPHHGTYVGQTFKINRTTGKIDSDFLPYTELEVIWEGSSKQPFVARTAVPKVGGKYLDWPNVQFLRIEEFRETAMKPFILVDVIDVKAGECK